MTEFAEQFDFVVVGSGGGSMAASLVMREAGKSVLVLEKTDKLGGSTARSGGVMWIPNNRFMKRDGIPDSAEAALEYLQALADSEPPAPGSTPERRRVYVEQAPRMIDFLHDQGIAMTRVGWYPDYYDHLPGASKQGRNVVTQMFNAKKLGNLHPLLRQGHFGLPVTSEELFELPHIKYSTKSKFIAFKAGIRMTLSKLTGAKWVSGGMSLIGRLLQVAVPKGVQFRVDSPVKELIVEHGRVTGVVAEIDGKETRIGARLGVLVNAGGFARNQAMRDQYQPGTSAQWTMAGPGDTGEMILEMMRHGAAIAQMDEMVGHQITIPPGSEEADFKSSAQRLAAGPHAILVDQTGVRYMSEGGSYMSFCKGMLERGKTALAVPSYAIFDEYVMTRYMVSGTMPGTSKPAKWYQTGYLTKADTIAELATKLNMDPATLNATVERFNGFARAGKDEDFGRGGRDYDTWLGDKHRAEGTSLGPVEEGPFYAIPVLPGDVGTYGGVITDTAARVLREDGSVIEGLYATGVSTASVMGRTYPGAGSSIGPSMTWGYVAARHALGANS